MKKILLLGPSHQSPGNGLQAQLEAEGFQLIVPACEADDWHTVTLEHQPDLVVIETTHDAYRPAFNVCRHLRRQDELSTAPVLLVNSSVTEQAVPLEILLEGLQAGAHDYVHSPYHLLELVGKVQNALRLRDSFQRVQVLAEQLNQVNDELYQRNIQVEKELYVARQLQQSLLPKPLPNREGTDFMMTKVHLEDDKLRISGVYMPCDTLGGDLYDFLILPNNKIGLAIADVSGHGVPAAFVTAIYKAALYRTMHVEKTAGDVLFSLNNELYNIVKTGQFITCAYMDFDLNTMKFECCGAGHPYPFFYKAKEDKMLRVEHGGIPLIWMKDSPYETGIYQLEPGDKLFLFTDGISELRNLEKDMYGEERLEEILLAGIRGNVASLNDYVLEILSNFTEGAPVDDDITMVLIEAL